MFYATRGTSLYVANLDGTGSTPLVTNETTVHSLAVDVSGGRVYWTDWLAQTVRSARLTDGGDVQTLSTGSARTLGLAVMPAP